MRRMDTCLALTCRYSFATTSLPLHYAPETHLEMLPYRFLRGLSSTSTSSAMPPGVEGNHHISEGSGQFWTTRHLYRASLDAARGLTTACRIAGGAEAMPRLLFTSRANWGRFFIEIIIRHRGCPSGSAFVERMT